MTAARVLPVAVALLLAAGASAATPAPGQDADAKGRSWFTDTVLVTQEGKPVRFYTDVLREKVVVIDFIFTR